MKSTLPLLFLLFQHCYGVLQLDGVTKWRAKSEPVSMVHLLHVSTLPLSPLSSLSNLSRCIWNLDSRVVWKWKPRFPQTESESTSPFDFILLSTFILWHGRWWCCMRILLEWIWANKILHVPPTRHFLLACSFSRFPTKVMFMYIFEMEPR